MPVQVETDPGALAVGASPPNSLSKYVLISVGSVLVSCAVIHAVPVPQVAL